MVIKQTVAPASEPVSLVEAKLHLRVDISDDDAYITGLITAARIYFEATARRALISQTWRLSLDAWPCSDEIALPRPPLQSVTSIIYKDDVGAQTTLASASYIVDTDSEPGRVVLAYGESWPSGVLYPANPIQITYVAGYGDEGSDVPEQVRQAIKLLVSHWYENREPVVASGAVPKAIPLGVDSLIWLNRAY
jgi:uncharacterized phiE125 gp8 family phage protein